MGKGLRSTTSCTYPYLSVGLKGENQGFYCRTFVNSVIQVIQITNVIQIILVIQV